MTRRALAMALVGSLATAAPAEADLLIGVTPTVTFDPGPGVYTYRYLVSNPPENAAGGDPDLIFDFAVSVAPGAGLTDLLSPTGWSPVYQPGSPQVEWLASDLPFTIAPGQSANFGFTSPLGPGDQGFTALALNQGGVELALGRTIGPAVGATAVPEPSGLILAGLGMAGLLGVARFGRAGVVVARE